jgi:hypothetical protein
VFVNKFAPRGAPSRSQLEQLTADGASLMEMADAADRSIATIRYWLSRWGIERTDRRRRRDYDPSSAPSEAIRVCPRHGSTPFVLESRGSYRCKQCRLEQVSRWRREVKAKLVAEAGGRCVLCRYDRCQAALQFHHLDRETKSFSLSHDGIARSLARSRAEAQKCVLLCANCHAEVEAGARSIEAA